MVFARWSRVLRSKMKNSNPQALRHRTVFSFIVMFVCAAIMLGGWLAIQGANSEDDEAPATFRKTLEFNGKIWKALLNSGRINRASTNPTGKIPRVNGTVGLDEGFDVVHWVLEVDSDNQDPNGRKFTVSLKDIMALPRSETSIEFRCIEGWSEDMAFAGVKFSDFMRAYNLKGLPYVGLVSSDGEYYVSIDLESMMHEQTLLAYEMNGAPLKPANGAPLRLSIPVKLSLIHI